jgi:hypothetical protein
MAIDRNGSNAPGESNIRLAWKEMEVPTMKLKWIGLSMVALSLALIPPSKAKASGIADGVPAAAAQEHSAWDMPPQEFRDIQRQGFHDGIEGARKDFDNHRKPDVENREEYRHPHVSASARDDYREGFRRGYEQGVDHLYGHHSY